MSARYTGNVQINRRQFIACCCTSIGGFAFAARETRLLVGVAKRRVTPPLWVPFLTSSGKGTHAPFQGVHDDLFARALVLDDGRDAIAVLAVDSIGYDNAILGLGRDFTGELRRKIAASTTLKPDTVMLAATHSHSTPETIGLTPFRDVRGVPEWLEKHLDDLAATVIEAWRNRVPARARAGVTKVEGVARNRRIRLRDGKESRRGPLPAPADVAVPYQMDEDFNILHFERENDKPLATLLNYTAHPVVAMLLPQVSADYPGAATALVERELPGSVCLFTNGCCGNINTVQVATNFDDVQTIGETLGRAALDKLRDLKPLSETVIVHRSDGVTLDGREAPLRAEVQAMRVGPVSWVSLPGEPFVETGLALKKVGATFVVGYANGWLGYFPIRRAYDEGGYEAMPGPWSRIAPGSAERLESAAVECLRAVSNGTGIIH